MILFFVFLLFFSPVMGNYMDLASMGMSSFPTSMMSSQMGGQSSGPVLSQASFSILDFLSSYIEKEIEYEKLSLLKKIKIKQGRVAYFRVSENQLHFVLHNGDEVDIFFKCSKTKVSDGALYSQNNQQGRVNQLKYQQYLQQVGDQIMYSGASNGMMSYPSVDLNQLQLQSEDLGVPSSTKVLYTDKIDVQQKASVYLKDGQLYTRDKSLINIVFKVKKKS